jgi:hypothetical protein
MFMTRVFNTNDQLVFITRNNSLLDTNNKVLAKIINNAIVAENDNVIAFYDKNQVRDAKGNPLLYISTDKAYFRERELCTLEGGNFQEQALGAAGFLFFG